ncbi:MAG: exodeoxyribonuclease VII small subunit [Opitutales bacterium]|nr:exodeoxyribonuclease VII small subunit [Opitutales bacterium]
MAEESTNLTFEQALEQLESLVTSMEIGETPLSKLVDRYAEGDELLRFCQRRLREAELKIEQLRSRGDDVSVQPLDLDPQS